MKPMDPERQYVNDSPIDLSEREGAPRSRRSRTKAHYEAYDAEQEREHGPDHTLEEYYSQEGDTFCMTTNEREDFEREMGEMPNCDLQRQETIAKMITWAKEGGLLHED